MLLQLGNSRRIVTPGAIPLDPELHGIEQILIAEGLRQELDRTGRDGRTLIGMSP